MFLSTGRSQNVFVSFVVVVSNKESVSSPHTSFPPINVEKQTAGLLGSVGGLIFIGSKTALKI